MCLYLYLFVPVSQMVAVQIHAVSVNHVQHFNVCTVLLPNAGTVSVLLGGVCCLMPL